MKHWNQKHGFTLGGIKSKFYNKFRSSKERCTYKNHIEYPRYGARGIQHLWENFESFRDDMHESYIAHVAIHGEGNTTLDRIDNNGNYCKENCRWTTRQENARNRRSNHILKYAGESLPMVVVAERMRITYSALQHRVARNQYVG